MPPSTDRRQLCRGLPLQSTIPDKLPMIRMDVDRITEVLVHLLQNAGRYSPAGTPIQITVELRKSEVVTSVADHGPGIDDMERDMIFEKFYEEKPENDRPGNGDGASDRQKPSLSCTAEESA